VSLVTILEKQGFKLQPEGPVAAAVAPVRFRLLLWGDGAHVEWGMTYGRVRIIDTESIILIDDVSA
jgi:hypothetical protein